MKPSRGSVTPAICVLRAAQVPFEGHLYDYVDGGGTGHFARVFGVDEHYVVKTRIMEDEKGNPLIALMHGDCQVSTQALARAIDPKRIAPCDPMVADKHSGLRVVGTSPFGTRRSMSVYCE